tara:strand:- start:132 stop:530 length:399 start_codon:yes stop_codon:yes gene_type:complete
MSVDVMIRCNRSGRTRRGRLGYNDIHWWARRLGRSMWWVLGALEKGYVLRAKLQSYWRVDGPVYKRPIKSEADQNAELLNQLAALGLGPRRAEREVRRLFAGGDAERIFWVGERQYIITRRMNIQQPTINTQ